MRYMSKAINKQKFEIFNDIYGCLKEQMKNNYEST